MKKIIIGIALAGAIDLSTVEAKYEDVRDLSEVDIEEINQEDDLNSLKQLNTRTSGLLKTIQKEENLNFFNKGKNPRYKKANDNAKAIKARIKILEKEQKAQATAKKRETVELNNTQNYKGGADLTKAFTNVSNIFSKTANQCKTLALNASTFNTDNNIDALLFISNEILPSLANCYQIAATNNDYIVKATTAQSKSKVRGDKSEIDGRRFWDISSELYEALSQNIKILVLKLKVLPKLSFENLNNEGNVIQLLEKSQNQMQGSLDTRDLIRKLSQIKSPNRQSQNDIDRMQKNLIPIYNMLNEIRTKMFPVIIDLIQDDNQNSLKQAINTIDNVLSNDEFNNNTKGDVNQSRFSSRSNDSYYDDNSLNRNNRNSSYDNNSSNRNSRNSSLNRSKSSNNISSMRNKMSSMSDNFNRETMRRSKNRTTLFSQQEYED